MKKQTLLFPSLSDLCTFAKSLSSGYVINTINLTLTTTFPDSQQRQACDHYKARLVETTDKVYSYNQLG